MLRTWWNSKAPLLLMMGVESLTLAFNHMVIFSFVCLFVVECESINTWSGAYSQVTKHIDICWTILCELSVLANFGRNMVGYSGVGVQWQHEVALTWCLIVFVKNASDYRDHRFQNMYPWRFVQHTKKPVCCHMGGTGPEPDGLCAAVLDCCDCPCIWTPAVKPPQSWCFLSASIS